MKPRIAATAAIAILCALAAALAARILLVPIHSTWLAVEAPHEAERGRAIRIVVKLARPEPGTYLHADLHGQDAGRRNLGYISGALPIKVKEGELQYSFAIPMPDRLDLAYVYGIVYLSGEGGWNELIRAARLEPVPVADADGPSLSSADPPSFRVEAFPLAGRFVAPRVDSPALRWIAALAFAASAAICLVAPRRSRVLAAACLAACAWELVLPEAALTAFLRGIFNFEGWYRFRRGPQIAISLLALGAGLAGAAAILARSLAVRRASRGIAALGVYAYACVAILRLVSEHDVDALLSRRIAGVQAGQAARLCCALLCILALAIGAMRDAGRGRGGS
jgi:hypothetical protein